MHPAVLFGLAFVSALMVLWVMLIIGHYVGRKKWKRIKRSGTGHTVTIDMGQQAEK